MMVIPERVRWALLIAWVAGITGLSLMPGWWFRPWSEGLPAQSDKFVHVAMYSGCVWLYACAASARRGVGFTELALAVLAAAGYGALMEVAQKLLPIERSFSWADMAANTVGAIAGALTWSIAARWLEWKQNMP